MAKQYEKSETVKFINPYTFIPFDKKEEEKPSLEEHYKKETYTGKLKCHIYVKTPIAIPDMSGNKISNEYDFMKVGNEWWIIPGSSIRGMIRSVFESATDSCLSTMREDTVLTKRIENEKAYDPGILIKQGEEWKLYEAKRYLILRDKIEDGGEYRFTRAKTGEEVRYGDAVRFLKEGQKVKEIILKEKFSEEEHSEEELSYEKGIAFIGEPFGTNKKEGIFCKNEEKVVLAENIEKAYEDLKKTLDIYRDKGINKQYRDNKAGEHKGYPDFEKAEKTGMIPIWYQLNGKKVLLSLGAVGRTVYEKRLNDLVGGKVPCTSRKNLCEACALFGMAKDEAVGGRIRFTDAKAINLEKIEKKMKRKVLLRILGQPRYSYLPFYAKGPKGKVPRSYDEDGVEIAGRKFYWHNKEAEYNDKIYTESEGMQNQNMSSRMDLVMPGAEFEFEVYFDGITKEQLSKFIWVLNLGENEKQSNLCHKIGHGKPLGLGSIKITIDEKWKREYGRDIYEWKEIKDEEIDTDLERNLKHVQELKKVLNFEEPKKADQVSIEYPDVCDENDRRFTGERNNDVQRHQWYLANRRGRGALPKIGDEQNIPAYKLKKNSGDKRERQAEDNLKIKRYQNKKGQKKAKNSHMR